MTPLASRLPPELLHLIIQEADSSPALAAWCGVSSGTLPIAGRLLWGEITISRQDQYAQFRTPEVPVLSLSVSPSCPRRESGRH